MATSKFHEITACRSCSSQLLAQTIDFGNQYVSDFVSDSSATGILAPLVVVRCQKCGLVQLKHTVDRKLIYEKYWYESGINESMVESIRDVALQTTIHANLKEGDRVLDIGANDGTLLRSYAVPVHTIGVEPSQLTYKMKGIDTIIRGFFTDIPYPDGSIKAITAVAMFYSVENPNAFLREVKRLLAPDGAFVIQMNDLASMIRNKTWDNIGHEHLEYYSLKTLHHLLMRNELEIYDVEHNNVNGGSMRVYAQHLKFGGTHRVSPFVMEAVRLESSIDEIRLKKFGLDIAESAVKLQRFLDHEISRGKKIYGYGASNRGNTILQYMGLTSKHLRAIADRNPEKWSKFTVGTNIHIWNEEDVRLMKPDYFFVLPYHLIDSFISREHKFLDRGGKFILPISEPRIVYGSGGRNVDYL